MCLHFLRSVYFASFSKNKDEKKHQRHLSLLKCTHFRRNYEAATTQLLQNYLDEKLNSL